MKHKLTVILSVAVIIAVAVFCLFRYEKHRNWQDVQNAKAKANAYMQARVDADKKRKAEARFELLKQQCIKDHQLFVESNGKSAAGDCDPTLQIVQ